MRPFLHSIVPMSEVTLQPMWCPKWSMALYLVAFCDYVGGVQVLLLTVMQVCGLKTIKFQSAVGSCAGMLIAREYWDNKDGMQD